MILKKSWEKGGGEPGRQGPLDPPVLEFSLPNIWKADFRNTQTLAQAV